MHAHLGDQMIWFQLPVRVAAAVLVWLDRRGRRGHPVRRGLALAVAALAVVASLASAVQVYRVEDSGARAVWGDQVSSAAAVAPQRIG